MFDIWVPGPVCPGFPVRPSNLDCWIVRYIRVRSFLWLLEIVENKFTRFCYWAVCYGSFDVPVPFGYVGTWMSGP